MKKMPKHLPSRYAAQWGLPLDRQISYAVKVLRDASVETYESCEGGEGHAFTEPTIRFFGGVSEGLRVVSVALQHGLPISNLRRFWTVLDGELTGPHWEITFHAEPLLRIQEEAERHGLLESEVDAAQARIHPTPSAATY